MLLRQLFETRSDTVAIIMGRFNPAHKGHKEAWKIASQYPIWYVGTNPNTQGPKDPLPFSVKINVMSLIWPEVESHIVPTTSWLTLASEVFEKHQPTTLVCCTDEEWVVKTLLQYNGKNSAHGFYEFESIVQQPTPRLSSATSLRDAVANGDKKLFSNAAGVDADTPIMGTTFFDLVQKYLAPYAKDEKKIRKAKKEKSIAEKRRLYVDEDGNARLALSSEWLITTRENGRLTTKLYRLHPSWDEAKIRDRFGFAFVKAVPTKGEDILNQRMARKHQQYSRF